ncbi:hypothetical protein E2C01_093816 [Portunus trituberculatus]|uniref:Uncharacterized protein n=1 Tax=Portunus trituberculatus TaxID=210409 RepID=A0A5B7JV82_PORTR|nr:hypothetical protein [Portunus trituberculatus]
MLCIVVYLLYMSVLLGNVYFFLSFLNSRLPNVWRETHKIACIHILITLRNLINE